MCADDVLTRILNQQAKYYFYFEMILNELKYIYVHIIQVYNIP
jgi:hypothetical protein